MRIHAERDQEFQELFETNAEYWRRHGGMPDFKGARILDIGSGLGNMAFDLARCGAHVVGVDISRDAFEFSSKALKDRYSEREDKIHFVHGEIDSLPSTERFDVIISKDSFEHIADTLTVLRHAARLLEPHGEIWIGFAPLYYSPFGDHGRLGLKVPPFGRIPWLHILVPDWLIWRRASVYRNTAVRSLRDVGLNGLTPQEFRAHLDLAGLEIVSIKYNQGDKKLFRLLNLFRRISCLEKYTTVNIYTTVRLQPIAASS